jgi:ABC-type multidrug transport system fused ATPase/permease subunit
MHADKIVVFQQGGDGCAEIAEEGKHNELLERNGIYAGLWRNHIGADDDTAETSIEELFDRNPK